MGVTVTIFTIRQKSQTKKLNSSHKYTIGFLRKRDWPADGGEMGTIYYYLKGVTYRAGFTLPQDKSKYKLDSRFFVKYYPEDPEICELLFEEYMPDTMTHYPDNGWDSLPSPR